jgi:hypothetical protein
VLLSVFLPLLQPSSPDLCVLRRVESETHCGRSDLNEQPRTKLVALLLDQCQAVRLSEIDSGLTFLIEELVRTGQGGAEMGIANSETYSLLFYFSSEVQIPRLHNIQIPTAEDSRKVGEHNKR